MRNTSGRLTKPKPAKHKPSRPIVTGTRFRETRQTCCLTVEGAAKLLRVSPRTVQNWEAGRTEVPYSAYKLMRILRGYRLPGDAWRGFRLVGDTLWSPEGLAFKAADHYWWSLTCRMAAEFRAIVAGRRVAQGFLRAVASTGPGGIPYQPDSVQVKPLWHQPDVTAPYFASVRPGSGGEGPSACTGPAPAVASAPSPARPVVPSANRGLKPPKVMQGDAGLHQEAGA
jgi:DNA-binding transcriptional regulator YiaG